MKQLFNKYKVHAFIALLAFGFGVQAGLVSAKQDVMAVLRSHRVVETER
ncbi:MAG: hypothetical protein JSS66_07755 [Armatimonadetes bacterium]|nr:hypothetical protein [Armatimonadota bacterium]